MKNTVLNLGRGLFAWLLLSVCLLLANAQSTPAARPNDQTQPTSSSQQPLSEQSPAVEEAPAIGEVVIDARGPIVTVYETIAGHTPEQRARAIADRIISIASSEGASAAAVRVEPRAGWTEIVSGRQIIMAVTEGDARIAGRSRAELAADYAKSIDNAIHTYQREHSWRMILIGVLKTAVATVVLALILWLIRRIRFGVRDRVERQIRSSARAETKSTWDLIVAYLGPISLAVGAIVRWIVMLLFVQSYLTVSLGFFSFTRETSLTVTRWVVSQLEHLGQAALDYLPSLLVVAVIVLVTYYLIRLIRLIFSQIAKGDLTIRGFYPDWAEPTEKLVRMLIFVLALIVCFPYLPGAKSPAFQGISIFVGLLLSLGSSSAVANAIAGIILTYMRSFLLGDWVDIGGTTGEVVEKTLLVTRLLTPKAEIITIPNATVMSGAVKNYSVEAKKSGVIFHTTVTIGYDAPWKTVHELLVDAALATPNVRKQPAPFVLQSQLSDFYVAYELNAYTDHPRDMLNIFSDLHQNIQDKFNQAGVEICSPHFSALRDGNVITTPGQYIPADYKPPAFRVQRTGTGE